MNNILNSKYIRVLIVLVILLVVGFGIWFTAKDKIAANSDLPCYINYKTLLTDKTTGDCSYGEWTGEWVNDPADSTKEMQTYTGQVVITEYSKEVIEKRV